MSSSPWGRIQCIERFERGLSSVSTSSHGGFRCSPGWAAKNLSPEAHKRGMRWGNALWYEEDCGWAIVAWEAARLWPLIFQRDWNKDSWDPYSLLLQTLSSWNCDYLRELGVTPDPEFAARYDARKEDDRRRAAKDPDLITAAVQDKPGTVKVWTADDREHYVTAESYDCRKGLNLLSKCVKISSGNGAA